MLCDVLWRWRASPCELVVVKMMLCILEAVEVAIHVVEVVEGMRRMMELWRARYM